MGARRIQRAMKAQIAPPKVAVEARPCAWAGRATSRGERSRAAGLAPSAERCERPVARFGLDPTGGPAADCTAGRASGRQAGPRQAAGQKIPFGGVSRVTEMLATSTVTPDPVSTVGVYGCIR